MDKITLVGIDLAKRIFHLCAVNAEGRIVWERRIGRSGVLKQLSTLDRCVVAMEACAGAHDWGRRIGELGHDVRLIHARRVAAFVGAHKNDRNDARAICEAARQPGTRFIPVKSRAGQDLQSLIRLRSGLVGERTAAINRLRGILQEYGVVLPRGRLAGMRRLRERMAEAGWEDLLSPVLLQAISGQVSHIAGLDRRITDLATEIGALSASDEQGARLMTIPGFGPLNTASLLGAVADPQAFPNGRQFAAWLGLVPRQDTTGGRVRLRGISKHGNKFVRRDLIHGARALVRVALQREQPRSRIEAWILRRRDTLAMNVLIVAVANKLARIAWAVMTRKETYHPYPA